MAEMDIFKEAQEKYFDYLDDSEVLIQFQGKEVLMKINAKAQEIVRKSGGKPEDVEIISNKLLGRKAVKNWRLKADHAQPGLTVGGVPQPFNPENIDHFMTHSTDFSLFVNRKVVDSAAYRTKTDINLDAIAASLFGDETIAKEQPDAPNA